MAAWFIDDLDQYQIFVTDTVREYYIPKFRINMEVSEPLLYLRWNDRERGTGGDVRLLTLNYLDVVDNYTGYIDNPSSATDLMNQIDAMIISGWTNISVGDLLNAKADLLSHDGVSDTILPGGANESILSRDNTELTGLKWIPKSQVMQPGGTDTQVQYNNGGVLDGDAGLIYDDADVVLSINGTNTMVVNGVTQTTHLEVHGEANSNHSEIEMHRHSNGDGTKIFGARSRGSFASPSVVQSGDVLMNIMAVGYDGTDFAQSSEIEMAVDTTPGSNDMPGRIVFRTSADGSQTLTERMRIDSGGNLTVADLGGAGNRLVQSDNNGLLSTRAIIETYQVLSNYNYSPVDATTVYISGGGYVSGTINGSDITPDKACTIYAVNIMWGATSVIGSGENISAYVRLNNTTDYLIATVGNTNRNKIFLNQSMNGGTGIALNGTTDYWVIKFVFPTWAANPTSVQFQGTVYYTLT